MKKLGRKSAISGNRKSKPAQANRLIRKGSTAYGSYGSSLAYADFNADGAGYFHQRPQGRRDEMVLDLRQHRGREAGPLRHLLQGEVVVLSKAFDLLTDLEVLVLLVLFHGSLDML